MKKILCIFGTRPEAIKFLPVLMELRKSKNFIGRVLLTGQHKELLELMMQYFHPFLLPENLNIMEINQSLNSIMGKIFSQIDFRLKEIKPDLILVQGDTTSALSASIAAFNNQIPIGHIEAGLRTYDLQNPFPEEMNRTLIDRISTLHFCPTKKSKENLIEEETTKYASNILEVTDNPDCEKLFVVGNTIIDSIKMFEKELAFEKKLQGGKYTSLYFKNKKLNMIDFSKRIILVTLHRRESWGKKIKGICQVIKNINVFWNNYLRLDDVLFLIIFHPNPKVKENITSILQEKSGIVFSEPLDYLDLLKVLKNCYFVLTDSGGLIEEACYFNKPILIAREKTERPEAIEAGKAKIIGTKKETILYSIIELLNNKEKYFKIRDMIDTKNLFGDGFAAERIVKNLEYYFEIKREKAEIKNIGYKLIKGTL